VRNDSEAETTPERFPQAVLRESDLVFPLVPAWPTADGNFDYHEMVAAKRTPQFVLTDAALLNRGSLMA